MRRSCSSLWLLWLGAMAGIAPAQTASIEGSVVNSLTGVPLARVHVTLRDLAGKSTTNYGAMTTADGRFSIAGVQSGTWIITGEHVGFAMPRGLGSRVTVTVKADDKSTGTRLALVPTGGITGRVTSSDGKPIENGTVLVEGATMQLEGKTDENGNFRVGGLSPGKYRVRASPAENLFLLLSASETRSDGSVDVHSSPTWYPSVLRAERAGKVEVKPDLDVPGVDIQLVATPWVRVSGKVEGVPPDAAAQTMVNLSWQGGGFGLLLDRDGSFAFWGLDPGRYLLSGPSRMGQTANEPTATIEIEVAGSNIDNVDLRPVEPFDLSGIIESDSPPDPAGGERKVQLFDTALPNAPSLASVAVAPDGTFRFHQLEARKYRLGLSWSGVWVQSLRLGTSAGDGDLLDLSNGPGDGGLSVRVAPAAGSISGTVLDRDGKPWNARVVILPAEENSAFEARSVSAKGGTYEITGLPPGSYKLVAVPEDDASRFAEPGGLIDYEDLMQTVDLADGQPRELNLTRPI